MGLEGGYRHSTSRHPGRPAGGNGDAGPEPGRGEAHSASQRDEGSGREEISAGNGPAYQTSHKGRL